MCDEIFYINKELDQLQIRSSEGQILLGRPMPATEKEKDQLRDLVLMYGDSDNESRGNVLGILNWYPVH